jgi:hypothetical protein
MRNPIESSSQFKHYKSFDKVAAKLIDKWPDLFIKPGKDKNVAIRSLGVKIGELNRGESRWWRAREAQTNCLSELLDIDRDDLGLHQKTGRNFLALSAFPDCPPLDLMREDGWDIARPELLSEDYPQINEPFASALYTKPTLDAWLSPQGSPYPSKKVEWLYVPDVTEYRLLTRKQEVRGRHQFASHNSLSDAIDKDIDLVRNQKPLILAIHEKSEADDLKALISYRQGAPLLVISLSPLPDLWTEAENKNAEQPNDGKTKIKLSDVNTWILTLKPDWRTQLLQWLEQRMRNLPNTLFSSKGAQICLDKLDPSGKWLSSVEDVLMLCQAVSDIGENKLKDSVAKDDKQLVSLLFHLDKSSLGSEILEQLIKRRWENWNLPWEGELNLEIWSNMLSDLCQFETIVTNKLVIRGMDGFDFQYPTVIRLLLRNQLITAFNKGDLAAWAPACFDNQRRPLVDAVLDAMNIDQLKQIAAQLIEEPTSAATIGAGEALFAAIGRRIIREEDIGDELPILANHFLKHLTWDDGMLWPYSRPLTSTAQQLEWICICWAWSLLPSPGADLPPNWLFPGWNSQLPQIVPEWLKFIASNFSSQDMTIPIRDFLSVVTRWLARHETLPTYENMPPLFCAGLLVRAGAGQWPAHSDWWRNLLNYPIAEEALLNQFNSANQLSTAAVAWWPSLVKHQREKFSNQFKGSMYYSRNWNELGYSVLLSEVMEQIDKHSGLALNELDVEDRKFLTQYPAALPTSVKCQLLRSLAKNFPKNWQAFEFINFFQHYGQETATEMEMFLDKDELGNQAAWCLWEWAPRKAEILLKKRDYNRKALRHLIFAIPMSSSSSIGDAVALLRDDPSLLSDKERRAWARGRLPDARQHAQNLLQLLNTKT